MENKHEEISIEFNKEFILRQNRFNANENLKLRISNTDFKVINYSTFGIGCLADLDLNIGDVVTDASIIFLGRNLQDLSLLVKRKEKKSELFQYGFELTSSDLDIERIQKTESLLTSLISYETSKDKFKKLPQAFLNLVNEMQIDLKNVERLVKPIENEAFDKKGSKEMSHEIAVSIIGDLMANKIRSYNKVLQGTLNTSDTAELKLALNYFRTVLGDYIFQSSFTKRSFEKPRGYAGDFEMMNQLYRNDNFSNTLFGSCVERAVNLHEEPQAVRNRSKFLMNKIVKLARTSSEKIQTLSVASGPAEEVKLAIAELTNEELMRITFNLLDQDQEALLYAQKNIKSYALENNKTVNVILHNSAIKDVITGSLVGKKFDLIYSAGLFDYFSDPVCSRAAKALVSSLSVNGSLIIGNFNISAPNWFGMLALFDWKLILRSADDLVRLFSVPGHNVTVESEPTNVNLFCTINAKK